MKVSILIAHYNNARYFKECYHSLLNQTYKNWEAVILDDDSRTEESEEVKRIIDNDKRFKFFKNSTNQGVGITKSNLIELSTGDICGFLDPDDALLPGAIESAVAVFTKEKKTVLTYSRFVTCDDNLKPIKNFSGARQVPCNDPYFFNYPIQIAHFVTFRRSIYFETEKMNSNLKIAEDQDLYLKMYEKGDVRFIDEANYLYRTHQGGISQNNNKNKSYEYFAKVLFDTFKRRNLSHINGVKIPKEYSTPEEIFDLLKYQNSILFRIKKKLKVVFQSILK